MYMAGVCDEQIQAFQNMVRNEDAQVTMQEKVKAEEQNRARQTVPTMVASGSIAKKDGGKEQNISTNLKAACGAILFRQTQAPTTKSYVVTKLRDKGSARELRKQLNDYLTSIDKAGTSIYEWEMRVAEIEDEMETIHKSRQRGKSA